MMNIVKTFIACLILCKGYAQPPETRLTQWASQSPVEKIYLHFDRSDYIAGQAAWLKAYVYSDFLPAGKTTDLFVELINSRSTVIDRLALPVFGGFAYGQIDLPDTLPSGFYTVRAYTPTMLNHDPELVFKRKFFVVAQKKKDVPVIEAQRSVRLEFFPEGGNFITGLSNSIAYKASDENGMPVSVSGVVMNEKGEKAGSFSSYHDGMGFFDLVAEEKMNYYALLDRDPTAKKYYLPSQTTKGVVFRVISSGTTKSFEILQRNDDPMFKASYMIGQMQHHVVFKRSFRGEDELTGIIPIDKLSSGILHITIFNKQGMPLAERLTFVDNKEYIQDGEILLDTLSFLNRGRNRFTLSLKDTVQGSFSVSITDAAFELSSKRLENIYSGLLLTSDLKGYVHNPAYYFSATNDSLLNALDLVMMTNGWRRFRWDVLLKDSLYSRKYSDPGYIRFSGKITSDGTKKPFADKDLLLFIVSANPGKSMHLVHTGTDGSFRLDSAIFFGTARILFTDIRGKKSKFIDVRLDGDSLHRPYGLPPLFGVENFQSMSTGEHEKKLLDAYNAIINAEGLMLEGVTLTARKKSALEETEEKYVSGLFSGTANSTLDVTQENMMGYRDIFDYLKLRVQGLQILTDPESAGYIVLYRQTATASAMGEIPMTIFLNEIPSDADAIASIPPHEIALVKVYSNFVGAWGNAPGGVLAIYTKKDADLKALKMPGEMISYRGYSVVKEFYSPDYSVIKKTDKPDQRLTLHWDPAIIANGIHPKIPVTFYNNDRTKQFKIVVEGMTADGKLLMIEKTVGARAF